MNSLSFQYTKIKVHEIFKNISDDDMKILGLNPQYSRPDWLVITVLPVPPPHVRPSVALDSSARSEDDITHQLVREPPCLVFKVWSGGLLRVG